MKSAGPKMMVSSRGDAPAIASTSTRPFAFSICASMPIRPTSSPCVFSSWVSSMSSAWTCAAVCTFGSITASRLAPAPSTTAMTSPYVHCVVQSFTRTTRVLPDQSPSLSAATMLARASSLASGDTESSRSRNTWSAGSPCALPSILRVAARNREAGAAGARRPGRARSGRSRRSRRCRLPTGHSAGIDGLHVVAGRRDDDAEADEQQQPPRAGRPAAASGRAQIAAMSAAPGTSKSRASDTTVGLVVAQHRLNSECPSSCAPAVRASSCSQVVPSNPPAARPADQADDEQQHAAAVE